MFKTVITPSIGEINHLRYVNPTVLPVWFETARIDIVRIFNPDCELSYKKWNLLLVNMDFNLLKQINYGFNVEIRTHLLRIGKTSVTLYQEAWQNDAKKADCKTTLIYYNYIRDKSCVIPEEIRNELKKHEKK